MYVIMYVHNVGADILYIYIYVQLREFVEKGAVQAYVPTSIHLIIHIPNVYTRIRVYILVLSCDNAVSPLKKCNIIIHLAPGLCKVSGHIELYNTL